MRLPLSLGAGGWRDCGKLAETSVPSLLYAHRSCLASISIAQVLQLRFVFVSGKRPWTRCYFPAKSCPTVLTISCAVCSGV